MLTIKFSRVGKKKYATYKIVIQEKARDPWGKVLEFLGTYNPHTKDLIIKKDRVEYWRSKGAQMTASINNLLINKEIIQGKKRKATKIMTKKRVAALKKKTEEQQKIDKEALAETKAETPKEEVKTEKPDDQEGTADTANKEEIK
jgi:small subunit ribosomal protein S16